MKHISEVLEDVECLEKGPMCSGKVEYRMPLTATGKSFPRCALHWSQRLRVQEDIQERYPDSPAAPAWFDPAIAGESWDEN